MSKFRARQLDASKPISIYLQEDITDFNDYNNVTNRTVPQLPTGMEKEEETEHHLQQAIFHQRVIPVPEVYDTTKTPECLKRYERLYPSNYKIPKQLIHIHPFSADQDIPDYDLDSEDEEWLREHASKGELLPLDALQFEEMMDRLEKASGLKAVTLQEAKLLLKDDDDLITAVFDYWLNKRLKLQHPLIPQVRKMTLVSQVKNEKGVGAAPTDPYVAFRKRTEKMQTRKNRKNDETSYEKMLKLRRDLTKAVTLLEMVKRREKSKREILHLNIEIFEKRNEMDDFSGSVLNEITSQRLRHYLHRPVFSSLLTNHQMGSSHVGISDIDDPSYDGSDISSHSHWRTKSSLNKVRRRQDESKRERRPHKRRRRQGHLSHSSTPSSPIPHSQSYIHPPDVYTIAAPYPQDISCMGIPEDNVASPSPSEAEEEANPDGPFTFRRRAHVTYHAPRPVPPVDERGPSYKGGGCGPDDGFSLTSISHPSPRFIGFARRRVGRGGRIWLDRQPSHWDDETRLKCDIDENTLKCDKKDNGFYGLSSFKNYTTDLKKDWPHFHPSSPMDSSEDSEDVEVDVETVSGIPSLSFHSPSRTEALSPNITSKESGLAESALPSSFYITAEIVEGLHEGASTSLRISLPPPSMDSDHVFVSDLLEGNHLEEVDILSADCGANSISETSRTLLTSNNSVVSDISGDPLLDSDNCAGTSSAKLTSCSAWSNNALSSNPHSNLQFETLPSSKFFTSDNSMNLPGAQVVMRQHCSPGNSNLTQESLTSGSCNSQKSSHPSHSFCNAVVKNVSSESNSVSCSSNSLSFSLSTTLSSSLATSLSNSLLCASQNYSLSKNIENTTIQEANCKKLSNHSSIYLNRQPKDNLQLHSLLSNKNNGNAVLNNANSSLVPQKILSSWTGENVSGDDSGNTIITNGPSNKPIAKPKVTQIILHDT